MNVTRSQVIRRSLKGLCPNCGGPTLFREGRFFKVNERCPACGLRIEAGDGAFLGPFVINYGITVLLFVVPAVVACWSGRLGVAAALALAGGGALLAPLFLYRLSWALWLMVYYVFLLDNLPANRGGGPGDDS
jgi:uncharacterized protein (DUF983 family)